MMSEIMLVPLPRAASRRLMSFLTFHISMFFSASLACCCWELMMAVVPKDGGAEGSRRVLQRSGHTDAQVLC